MAEFVEDLFVLQELGRLGFGKDERYRERIEKIAKLNYFMLLRYKLG